MNKEYIFFLKYNLNNLNVFNTLKHIYYKSIHLVKKRISKKNYPEKYLYLRKLDFISDRIAGTDSLSSFKNNSIEDNSKINLDILLATRTFKIKTNQDIYQKKCFDDPEDYESLHRFIWIRYYLSKEKINLEEVRKIESLIMYWCKSSFENDERLDDKLIWEPYTVSERLINIIFFYNKIEKDIPLIVSSQLDKMTKYIIKNLEFYNTSYGNHLINNFRGILFYAITFENTKLIEIFSKLMDQYLDNFIEDGFTKDFSSHYQLLVYFWLYDLSKLAKKRSQKDIIELLDKYLKPLHEKSIFFYSEKSKHLSRFGDISPDLPPKYLISLLDNEYFFNEEYSALRLYRDNHYVG